MKKLLVLLTVMMSFQVKATNNMENIKVIVSYPPGSAADSVFRILQSYGLKRNINFVPEFKPGAQGLIAAEHAITIVGYDNDKQYFICRNSYGEQWGDQGYFYMPYEYAELYASDSWTFDIKLDINHQDLI